MNALADKVEKTRHAMDTVMHSIKSVTTFFNNHPYISSSGMPVGRTKFTAIYVGMVVEYMP